MPFRCLFVTFLLVTASTCQGDDKPLVERSVRGTGSVTAFFTGWSPAERKIHDALADVTTVNFADTPLIDAVEYISRQHEIPVIIDVVELEENGILVDEPVNLILSGISLRSTLRIMLRDLQLGVMVSNDILVVTTRDQTDAKTTTRTYPVRDLIRTEQGDAWKELIEAVRSAAGTTWETEGEADRTVVPVPSLGSLVITQNQRGHESIVRLLDALRGAQVSDGIKSVRKPTGYLPFESTEAAVQGDARYLRVTPVLVVDPEYRRTIGTMIAQHHYDLKDELQLLLSDMSLEEVRSPVGIAKAKKAVAELFNRFLVARDFPRVKGVLFDGWRVVR